ncbi:MAG: hypothetical protein LBP75_08355 [Planctomycetota bacterium]|jgi:hypothetical protein|nr:hypothetical protein [Planctomycetota bacterium]
MNITVANPVEDEIDAIRDKIYENIKDMTPDERTAYFRRRTEPVIKQYHLKMAPAGMGLSPEQRRRNKIRHLVKKKIDELSDQIYRPLAEMSESEVTVYLRQKMTLTLQ